MGKLMSNVEFSMLERGENSLSLLYRIPILFAIIVTLSDNILLITLSLQLAINLTFQS